MTTGNRSFFGRAADRTASGMTFVGLAFLALLLPVVSLLAHHREARAEEGPEFTRIAIAVIPEYDEPNVLVILRGELPADTPLPLEVSLRLPMDTTGLHTCSSKLPDDELVCAQAEREETADYLLVTYEVTTPVMYVEYYYGAFAGVGERSSSFSLWPPYPAKALELTIPIPPDATDFNTVPEPGRVVNEQGTRHFIFNLEDVPAGEPIDVQMTYSRPSDQPWATIGQERTGTAPLPPSDKGGLSLLTILFMALSGGLVVAFVAYASLGRHLPFGARPAAAAAGRAGRRAGPSGQGGYCRHCGEPSRPHATFCSRCGEALRLTSRGET